LDFSTNVVGTYHVLEAARRFAIPVAVCSSIHTYGPDKINSELSEVRTRYVRTPVAINETEPLLQGCLTPLHASKRCGEIYTQCFIDTFGLRAACFRLTGIYGPWQFGGEDHGWVANFAIRILAGRPLTVFGNGKQLRDILFASDVVSAFEAFYRSQKSGIYTLGAGRKAMISLIESIGLIEELVGKKAETKFEGDRFGDLKYFVADSTKFQKATGWRARVLPREGIGRLIQWARENAELFYVT
jgi:CDP-paratose 2-epimerase